MLPPPYFGTLRKFVCMQASNMSTLWLEEMHLENTMPRYRQPLAHSMPWQLANHALVYPQEQLTEVQYSPCLKGPDGLLLTSIVRRCALPILPLYASGIPAYDHYW